jgi:long-chain acyl-CoA synthetase
VWARKAGISFASIAELASNAAVVAEVQSAVDETNRHVSQVESIKRFTILPVEWTPASEELTPTLKLKRRVISQKYARQIDEMYAREECPRSEVQSEVAG